MGNSAQPITDWQDVATGAPATPAPTPQVNDWQDVSTSAPQTSSAPPPVSPADQLSKDEMVMTRGMANQTPTDPQEKAEFESGKKAGTIAGGSQIAADVVGLGVGPVLGKVASKIGEAIPSTKRAGQAFQELEQSIGTHPVGVDSELSKSVNELKQAVTTTNTNLPPVVRKLIDRLDPFTGAGELTYKEGRAFSSEIGNLAAQDKMSMTANTKRLVGNLDHALTNAVQNTADLAGEGQKLAKAMKDYHYASKISGLTGKAATYALRTAVGVGGLRVLKELGLFD
jgi:hypothetical protein